MKTEIVWWVVSHDDKGGYIDNSYAEFQEAKGRFLYLKNNHYSNVKLLEEITIVTDKTYLLND